MTLKHRFTYGVEAPKGSTYFGLLPSLAASDGPVVACSATHFAIPYSGGGGPIYVSSLSSTGKVEPGCSVLNAHKGAVLDMAFSPFHDNMMVAGSLDCTLSLWDVTAPAEMAPLSIISTHRNSVRSVDFHPTVPSLVVSTAHDTAVHFSDISAGRDVGALTLSASSGAASSDSVVNNVAFSYDGCILAATCKDKCLRFIDPRVSTGAAVVDTLSNPQALGRNSRVAWLSSQSGGSALLTCGLGGLPSGQRVLSLWDARKGEVVMTRTVDTNSGQLYPLLDETGLCFLVGKGDTVVKYYETTFLEPADGGMMSLDKSAEFQSSLEPFAGVCMLPKRCCDVRSVECARLLKLTSDSVVPLSFYTPRSDALKAYFQDDLFPPVRSHQIEDKCPTVADFFGEAASSVFFPSLQSLQPEGLLSLSQRPEADSRRVSVSRSDEFRLKQAEEANAQRLREEDFQRLQALAAQNAAYHPNQSMNGGGEDVEEDEWN